jgi:hypothetical protein
MDIYVLFGDGNRRKSSTVRALTGASSATPRAKKVVWDIAYGSATHPTYVLTGALQESQTSVPAAIRNLQRANVNRAMFPLRYQAMGSYPDAQTYIDAFRRLRWKVHVATLQPGLSLAGHASLVTRPNAATLATNFTAAALRRAWGIR